ncbi:TPA: phage tail protein [Klebsiella pneumoniae]|nr:phage tail protein [Klebsiella pneumoniae]HDY4998479.1 phage tail protein [Klebsiella pneumoniae]
MSDQLESLTNYLMARTPARIHGFFEAEITGVQLIRSMKDLGLGQMRIGISRSTVMLSWYAYPYREYPPSLIYALVMAWIEGQANALFDELQLPDPAADVSLGTEQQGRGDLTITLELAEALVLRQHEQGEIGLCGKRWTLHEAEVWTAETFDVAPVMSGVSDAED